MVQVVQYHLHTQQLLHNVYPNDQRFYNVRPRAINSQFILTFRYVILLLLNPPLGRIRERI